MTYWILNNLGTISLTESCTEEGVIIVDVRDVSDVERDVKVIRKKIEVITNLIMLGFRVAIRCYGGINRSNAIAIGVLCSLYSYDDVDTAWDFHYAKVKAGVRRVHITPELERTIKQYLKNLL